MQHICICRDIMYYSVALGTYVNDYHPLANRSQKKLKYFRTNSFLSFLIFELGTIKLLQTAVVA